MNKVFLYIFFLLLTGCSQVRINDEQADLTGCKELSRVVVTGNSKRSHFSKLRDQAEKIGGNMVVPLWTQEEIQVATCQPGPCKNLGTHLPAIVYMCESK
ncbi:DUF4156 domain-containing protein [Marinibactrum halimedae]|uniref:Lipoprotein n=1 Tax=Marinibactrum halimedae TaxID=1444977 RepID=A0AA37WLV6_9GAMM|nr:DUF4156 domain-containing protein [Marinibactrum halimedae]MCD9461363.1 DUF4156 domain-containing protein [Marinibactrum halimedae]GLS26434.1 hypothetical protein GCM10007877_21500 [Marinibactrum halimedae]